MIKNTKYISILILYGCIAPPSLYQEAFLRSKDAVSSQDLFINNSIRELPYAMQLAKIGNSNEVLLVLAEAKYDYLIWSSASKELITTFNGKIIKTSGLNNDINIINPPNIKEIYFNLIDNPIKTIDHKSLINFTSPKASALEIFYSYKLDNGELVKSRLNNKFITTLLVVESFSIPIIRFKGENKYWVDSEGSVVKTSQKLEPYGKSLRLQKLKKYNGR